VTWLHAGFVKDGLILMPLYVIIYHLLLSYVFILLTVPSEFLN